MYFNFLQRKKFGIFYSFYFIVYFDTLCAPNTLVSSKHTLTKLLFPNLVLFSEEREKEEGGGQSRCSRFAVFPSATLDTHFPSRPLFPLSNTHNTSFTASFRQRNSRSRPSLAIFTREREFPSTKWTSS